MTPCPDLLPLPRFRPPAAHRYEKPERHPGGAPDRRPAVCALPSPALRTAALAWVYPRPTALIRVALRRHHRPGRGRELHGLGRPGAFPGLFRPSARGLVAVLGGGAPGPHRGAGGDPPAFIALFALSTWLMARLGTAVAGPRAGLWAAVLLNLSPVFGITTATWVLPDGPLDCALLGRRCAWSTLCRERGRAAWGWWGAAGLCAGLALFSKYSAGLVIAGGVSLPAGEPAAPGLAGQAATLRRRGAGAAGVLAWLNATATGHPSPSRATGRRACGSIRSPRSACWPARRCSCCRGSGCR